MASNSDPLQIVIGHLMHPFPDSDSLFSFPCRWLSVHGDPLQALLEGKGDAVIIAGPDLPDRFPAGLDIVALVSQNLIQEIDSSHPLRNMSAIVAKKERADLKVLFSPIDIRQSYGKVYLTGAGAGGRDYLTLRADALLRNADVIFYDDLIDTGMLDCYEAEKIFVGKRKGRHHADQEAINSQLFLAAKKKQVVVRLKGGDPLIFGRGGEELAYLLDRHIDVEIVAGVSAVQNAAASAGIPLTLRAVSGGVTLLSAHNALAGSTDPTLAYYMCASRLKELQCTLIDNGTTPQMPVALVYKAGFADESITLTSVGSLHLPQLTSPLLAIIGPTASLYRMRSKILYTGTEPYRCLLPGKILSLISLKTQANSNNDIDLSPFSGIAFTTPEQVDSFLETFPQISSHLVLYAYGKTTAEKLRKNSYSATVQELDSQN
ncbi:MAG: uroporphyrinogen-III C-methyltransferase [Chlorobiaceae bacterium]